MTVTFAFARRRLRAACIPAKPAPMMTTCGRVSRRGWDAFTSPIVAESPTPRRDPQLLTGTAEVTATVTAAAAAVAAKTDGHAPIFFARGCEMAKAAT